MPEAIPVKKQDELRTRLNKIAHKYATFHESSQKDLDVVRKALEQSGEPSELQVQMIESGLEVLERKSANL
jgi:predicted transcriptional regulator